MSYYVDAHCHLDLLKDIPLNVSKEDSLPIKSINVTNAPFIFEHSERLFAGSKNIRVALGMHPELVSQYSSEINLFKSLIASSKYIGEIGLDGSSRFKESFTLQRKIFSEILECCKKADGKILTLHSRSAAKDVIELLEKSLSNSNCRIILHWFSGSLDELKKAVKNGYYFSINHKMLASENGREICKAVPNNLLLTETDAPFTLDSKINNRLSSIQQTIKSLAELKRIDQATMKETIYTNFATLLKSML
jgi:TatD DNase family protein